jgi:DNA gyrase/topoisomerase IV subunit B
MPQLIEAGKVYKAVPPLYSISSGKKTTYFTDQVDITRYIQKYFSQNHEIKRVGKGESKLNNKELTVLFLTNVDYVYELERISRTYAMDPQLLEMVLLNYYNNKSIASLKKQIKSNYRFMDITKKNGVSVVEGTIDKSYKLYITDRLISDCSLILDIIKKNESTSYMMDGKEASLYEIMKEYEKCTPNGMQRYKGLGEMDVEEIIESTMSPFTNRTLVRYTLEDAKEEIEAIRQYESDLSKLLSLVGEVNRQDLLD